LEAGWTRIFTDLEKISYGFRRLKATWGAFGMLRISERNFEHG